MNIGDIVRHRKKMTPVVKWAKAVLEAESALAFAQECIGKTHDVRRIRDTLTQEITELQSQLVLAKNELHAEQSRLAQEREFLSAKIGEARRDAHLARAKAKAQIDGYHDQVTAAQETHDTALSTMAEQLLQIEGIYEAAVDKYNQFKMEVTSHG